MVDNTADDAISLHLPKLLDQHFLRYRRNGALKVRKTHDLSTEKMEENDQFPAPFQHFKGLFCPFSRRGWRVLYLTFR